MTKTKKMLVAISSLSAVAALAAVPAFTVSCGKKEDEPAVKQDKVIFAAPQGAKWPLMRVVKPLVEEYNKNHTNDKDFVEVELWTQDQVKTFSELALVNNTINNIEAKDEVIPNILLSNQSGAFILKSRNALLDLQKNGLNVSFNEKVAKSHSILAGQSSDTEDQLYNIPFDICDIDALLFNLDVMYKLFSIIEANGGHVDHEMDLYKKALNASKTGTDIPERSAFNAIMAKPVNKFAEMNVTADTFKSFANIRKFVTDVYNNVTFDQSKINENTEDARLLSIDYQEDVFKKELQAMNSGSNSLWSLAKTEDKNQPTKVDLSNLLNKDSEPAKNLVKLFNEWKEANKAQIIKEGNKATFQTIDFKDTDRAQQDDWGNFDIRKFDTAIAYAAAVGGNYAEQSLWGKAWFLQGKWEKADQAEYAKWASHYDVVRFPAVDARDLNGKKVYWEGGSSIVGVKSASEKLNKGAIAFLNFLYNGKSVVNGKEIPNFQYIAETSGYIVPAKQIVTQENLETLQKAHDDYIAAWKNGKDSKDKKVAMGAEIALTKANNLRSAIISLQSLLNFTDGKNNVQEVSYVGDNKTAQLVNVMKKEILKMTKLDNKANSESKLTGEQFLEELQKQAQAK